VKILHAVQLSTTDRTGIDNLFAFIDLECWMSGGGIIPELGIQINQPSLITVTELCSSKDN